MIRGRTQDVRFVSDPPGAAVTLTGAQPAGSAAGSTQVGSCVTPCTMHLVRSSQPAAYRVELLGYQPLRAELVPAGDPLNALVLPMAFDLILLVPFMIDMHQEITWGWPKEVAVSLPPVGTGAPDVTITR